MLYVDDVAVERETFGLLSVLKLWTTPESWGLKFLRWDLTLTFTVYAKDFIRQASPEVVDMKSSLLFESADLHVLHKRLAAVTDTTSPISTQPFPHFNFANPSGHYFAVRGI